MRNLMWICGLLAALPAMGGTLSYEGDLNDTNDVALVGSGTDGRALAFDDVVVVKK